VIGLSIRARAPYKHLLKKCEPVQDLEAAKPYIVDMVRLLVANKLEGLSANQCDWPYMVFVTNVKGDMGPRVFINPQVTVVDYDEEVYIERCASYPRNKKGVPRWRHAHVIVDAINYKNESFILDTTDPMYPDSVARRLSATIQHELEHLYGVDVRTTSSQMTSLDERLSLPQIDRTSIDPDPVSRDWRTS
jgi:peptide deformylase